MGAQGAGLLHARKALQQRGNQRLGSSEDNSAEPQNLESESQIVTVGKKHRFDKDTGKRPSKNANQLASLIDNNARFQNDWAKAPEAVFQIAYEKSKIGSEAKKKIKEEDALEESRTTGKGYLVRLYAAIGGSALAQCISVYCGIFLHPVGYLVLIFGILLSLCAFKRTWCFATSHPFYMECCGYY